MRQENEQHAQRKYIQRRIARRFFLIGQFGPFEAIARGQNFLSKVSHNFDSLPATNSRRAGAVDFRRWIKVVPIDAIGIDNIF